MGIKAESFNLAIGGNGSARSEIILRKALDYEPSLIILHVDNGDEFEDEREFKRAEAFKSWHPKNWLMKSFFVRRLYEFKTEQIYWKWIPEPVRELAGVNDAGDKQRAGQNPETRREWDERVRKNTAEKRRARPRARRAGFAADRGPPSQRRPRRLFARRPRTGRFGSAFDRSRRLFFVNETTFAADGFRAALLRRQHALASARPRFYRRGRGGKVAAGGNCRRRKESSRNKLK